MAREGFRVQVIRFLQFWRNKVVIVFWRYAFVFGALADSQEQVENRAHSITSDGGTASPLDATSSGEREYWEEITTALTKKPSAPRELQISNDIDLAGEFKVPIAPAALASQPTDTAAREPSALCQTPPPRRSLADSKEQGIIIALRTPTPAVQDVKIGNEVLVLNTSFVNIESLNQDHVRIRADAVEDRFQKFGKLEFDNAAAGGLPVDAQSFKGPAHVPSSVSEGSVSTFAMHVDQTKTTLVPNLEKRRTTAGDGAEVCANFEQNSPTQKSLPLANDGSLGQGSSSSSFM